MTDPRAARAIVEFGAQQKVVELTELLEYLAPLEINSVLEVGSWTGGTLWLWAQIAREVVSIDLRQRGEALGELPAPVTRIYGDSHDPATKAKLGDRHFDLVHIDGDHTDAGVRQDWEMYGPLGRYVAIHDIVPHLAISGIHVEPFWAEIKTRETTVEFVNPLPCPLSRQGSYDAGIGLVLR